MKIDMEASAKRGSLPILLALEAFLGVPGCADAHHGGVTLAFGPALWKDLNEEDEQQGSEGLEKYRLIGTLSFFF